VTIGFVVEEGKQDPDAQVKAIHDHIHEYAEQNDYGPDKGQVNAHGSPPARRCRAAPRPERYRHHEPNPRRPLPPPKAAWPAYAARPAHPMARRLPRRADPAGSGAVCRACRYRTTGNTQ